MVRAGEVDPVSFHFRLSRFHGDQTISFCESYWYPCFAERIRFSGKLPLANLDDHVRPWHVIPRYRGADRAVDRVWNLSAQLHLPPLGP